MTFGFVVHPLSATQRALMSVRTLSPRAIFDDAAPARRVARFARITSPAGAHTQGSVVSVPMLPGAMLRDQERAVAAISAGVARLHETYGAGIVGLGSLCAVLGLRGEEVAARAKVPVTTGVSFTAFACTRTLETVCARLGERLDGRTVAIAGFPGALAFAIAELVAARGAHLLVSGDSVKALERAAAKLASAKVSVAREPSEIARADFVIGASSTGHALDARWLGPGSVVVDAAEPRDLPGRPPRDVLVVDGENVSLPEAELPTFTRIYDWVVRQRHGTVYACFAEPIALALEGRAESFSLGKAITPARAEEIGALGEKHGFRVLKLLHRGREVQQSRIDAIAALRRGLARMPERAASSGALP